MRIRAASAVGFALVLSACASRAPEVRPEPFAAAAPSLVPTAESVAPADRAPPAPGAIPPAPPVDSTQTVVLWTQNDRPGRARPELTTYFLRADGSILASRPGALIAVGERLWRWSAQTRISAGEVCASPNANLFPVRKLERISLAPVRGGAAVEVLPFAEPLPEEGLPAEETHELVASLGPFLFARTDAVIWPCGMHPGYAAGFSAWELSPGGALRRVELGELDEGASAALDAATQSFGMAPGDTGSSLDGPVAREEVSVTMAYPVFGASGLVWTAQFTANASWAGSYGGWSGYTRSVTLALPKLPRRLGGRSSPSAALAFAAAHPDRHIGGVSFGAVSPP